MPDRILIAALLAAAMATPALAQDHGKQVFQTCAACHTGADGLGPDLKGVVGRPAGSLPDFRYSGPMKRSGLTWTPETLHRYLTDPQGVVPGNRMPMAPLSPADADAVIAYLQTMK
jgi:cytochrome c